jgi:hypothetical protein
MARGRMGGHKMHGSPASMGASMGPGPVRGAGEVMHPGAGPGVAARKKMGAAPDMFPAPYGAQGENESGMGMEAYKGGGRGQGSAGRRRRNDAY